MSVEEYLRKGIAAGRAGRKGEARATFRAVLTEDPANETALLWLAYLSEDPRASLAYIARALEANPRSPRALAALRWARNRLRASGAPSRTPVSPGPQSADLAIPPWAILLVLVVILTLLFVLLGDHAVGLATRFLETPTPSPTATWTPTATLTPSLSRRSLLPRPRRSRPHPPPRQPQHPLPPELLSRPAVRLRRLRFRSPYRRRERPNG